MLITRNGYVTEVEIKVTLSDWKQDFEKPKHQKMSSRESKLVKRFYYAGPLKLMSRFAELPGLPEYAGIVGIRPDVHEGEDYTSGKVEVLRKAKDFRPSDRVTVNQISELNRLTALRYWDQLKIEEVVQ
jgi:hypothetical protein